MADVEFISELLPWYTFLLESFRFNLLKFTSFSASANECLSGHVNKTAYCIPFTYLLLRALETRHVMRFVFLKKIPINGQVFGNYLLTKYCSRIVLSRYPPILAAKAASQERGSSILIRAVSKRVPNLRNRETLTSPF